MFNSLSMEERLEGGQKVSILIFCQWREDWRRGAEGFYFNSLSMEGRLGGGAEGF